MADRLSRDERESRDTLIYRLHLAGVSYRDIARRVGITKQAVHKIVQRELAKAAAIQDDLQAEAEAEHLERLSTLLSAQWPKAVAGDSRAAEFCRRLMVDMARVRGLNTSVAERLAPIQRQPDDDDAFGDHELTADTDELARYRRRYENAEGRAEADSRISREYDEAERRGISWCELTCDDKRRLHAVSDVG